ncbi:MAG: histidine kinase dimerization/phosphoacceptor domain -containing protein [Crocinitomicaceae bacterium]
MIHRFLQTIEELSKSSHLHQGDTEGFASEVLQCSTRVLECERSNIWIFNEDQSEMYCLMAYDQLTGNMSKMDPLSGVELPNYFSHLKRNEIIVSENAKKEPMNAELLEDYLIPYNIGGMIDIPIRSEGKMIGVVCFEHVGKTHLWSIEEQKFCQSVAQLITLTLETNQKKALQEQLEQIIKQKEILIQEINHRVKNNLAVIMSLLNLQKHNAKDAYHERLFDEIKDKVYTMSLIQEQLHTSENIDSINLEDFLRNLVENLNHSYGQGKNIHIQMDLDVVPVDVSKAIPCGLIANEILTNSFKYAFSNHHEPVLNIHLSQRSGDCVLEFKDNGPGFDPKVDHPGMGMDLISDLSGQIDGDLQMTTQNGVSVSLTFPC